jgi:transcriptional regulator with XRE-family HTH domain
LASQHFSPSRLKDLREAAGLTRTQVASFARRSEQSVWLWERGKVTPSIDTLERVASALGCSVTDFFIEDGVGV